LRARHPGVSLIVRLALLASAIFFLRGARWAYIAFVALAFVYFPASVGFHVEPRACELWVGASLALFSFTNYAHIVMLGAFFVLSFVHFTRSHTLATRRLVYSTIGTLALGILIELGEGLSGTGHCRLRDLLPDSAGIALGALLVWAWLKVRTPRAQPPLQPQR
jgi:hypothetical protein